MLNISYIIPIVCFLHTFSSEISKYKHELLSNNLISFANCLIFIFHHNYDYNLDYAVHMSIGFYIYDLMYMFSRIYRANTISEADRKVEIKRNYSLIIHHVVGICILNASITGECQEILLGGYNILEKSNIMSYIAYYLHKEYANWVHLNIISNFCQLIMYSYFRLFIITGFIYNNESHFFQFYFTTQFMIVAIYSMGIIWSYKLLNKNIKNLYILAKWNVD